MTRFTIFDLDNCLSDDAWRIPHIDWRHEEDMDARYARYHALHAFDELDNDRALWDAVIEHRDKIVILTARPLEFRVTTEEWLRRMAIEPHALIMRNPGDRRRSVDLKRWMLGFLHQYGVEHSAIRIAYDDRPEIVEMYRSLGIPAEVLKIHDVCAYTRPAAA